MPYRTIWESAGVRQRFLGVVTSPELLDSLTDAHDDPRFDSLEYVIQGNCTKMIMTLSLTP